MGEFFRQYGPVLLLAVVMMALVFALLRGLSALREQAERELRALYGRDVNVYLERLENNRLLTLVFRKSLLLLYRLEGYMKLGDDEKIRHTIAQLDRMKLPPRDRLEFYQQRLSYFASAGEEAEARASRDRLAAFLQKSGAAREERYRSVLEEADQIVSVYVDRDTSLLSDLKARAADEGDPVRRGVLQFRAAKLLHFAGDDDGARTYLKKSEKNLRNTYYEVIIKEAMEDTSVLERK